MTLADLMKVFSTEEACREWFETSRSPEGPECPRCNKERISTLNQRHQFTCLNCRYRFSVTSGTVLHSSKLPLSTWIIGMYFITTSRKGLSARQLATLLGVSYKTAWFLAHRIRSLLVEETGLLEGIVELDETYIGGRPRRKHKEKLLPESKKPKRKKGRGVSKPCVFVAVQRQGRVRAKVVSSNKSSHLGLAVRESVSRGAILCTDELPAYTRVGKSYRGHLRVTHAQDEFSRWCPTSKLKVHVNTAESFNASLKRAIYGVWHHLSRRHLHRYLAEVTWRWNHRDVIMKTLATLVQNSASPLPLSRLVT